MRSAKIDNIRGYEILYTIFLVTLISTVIIELRGSCHSFPNIDFSMRPHKRLCPSVRPSICRSAGPYTNNAETET